MEKAAARQPNIEAAIRRSRNARAAERSRGRRSVLIAAAFAAALAGGGVLALDPLAGSDAVHAAVTRAESLADLLGQRSPGSRTTAQLTKNRKARALAKAHARPPEGARAPAVTELARLLMPPPAEVPLELAPPLPMASLISPAPLAGLVSPPPGGGGSVLVPPAGGGGISPPGQTMPEQPRQPLPSAVPEPGSWALMLLGFGLIGWRSRRVQSRLQTARG